MPRTVRREAIDRLRAARERAGRVRVKIGRPAANHFP